MRTLFKNIIVAIITLEAQAVVHKYKPKIVAVTGSVGKTSTKDAIFAALQKSEHVRKSQKSFNSEVGIPLTILGAPNGWNNPLRWLITVLDGLYLILFRAPYPEWLVLEVGADRPGDIRSLSRWLRAEVVVITRLPEVPVHVEFFESAEAVIEEKASLINALVPNGTLILFGDDKLTRSLERRLPETQAKLLTFGFNENNDVRGLGAAALYDAPDSWPVGMTATIAAGDAQSKLDIRGVLGTHAFLPALAAAAVASALGKNLGEAVDSLRGYEPPPGRMHLMPGIKDTLVIDDTYNASPAAAEAALEALKLARRPRHRAIAALGDMLELGRVSVQEHRKLGIRCAEICDILITVGFRARDIAQGALEGGMDESAILQFEDSQAAGEALQNLLKAGDAVLVKGSQSIRMERIVKEIMAEPERAAQLLVRQDEEWKKR